MKNCKSSTVLSLMNFLSCVNGYKTLYLENKLEDPHFFPPLDCDQHSPKYQIKLLIQISLYLLSIGIIILNSRLILCQAIPSLFIAHRASHSFRLYSNIIHPELRVTQFSYTNAYHIFYLNRLFYTVCSVVQPCKACLLFWIMAFTRKHVSVRSQFSLSSPLTLGDRLLILIYNLR